MLGYVMDKWQLFFAKLINSWKSLHIWFNGSIGLLIAALPFLQDQFPQMQPFLNDAAYRWMMGGIVAANIISRFYITQCLSKK